MIIILKSENTSINHFSENNRVINDADMNKLLNVIKTKDYRVIRDLIQYMLDNRIQKECIHALLQRNNETCYNDYYAYKIEEIYNQTGLTYLGYEGLTDSLDNKELTSITNIIKEKKPNSLLIEEIGSDKEIQVDCIKNIVQMKYKKIVNEKDNSRYEVIINASPEEIIIYDSPITEAPRTFSIKWRSNNSNRSFITAGEKGAGNLNEIVTHLENAGYSPNPRHLKGAVASTINSFINAGLAIIKEDVENPGFFYDKNNDKILCIKYGCNEPSITELREAIRVLHKLGKYFKGETSTKLASALKWGWVAPFNYVKKQKGAWLPWLYLYGQAGSGKTTIGKILLYLWDTPNETNETGGSSFDSEYKIGIILNRSTFPHLINEPLGLFQRKGLFEMLKTSIEHTIARSKSINGVYTQIHGFSPIIFTANQQPPQDDAFLRRTYRIPFHYDERKTETEKREFKKEFNTENPNKSILKKLHSISHYIANKIINNPDLIDEDWEDLITLVLIEIEAKTNEELPPWLWRWHETETLQDYDDEQRETLRMFFMKIINDASRKITVLDENGRISEGSDFFDDTEASNNTDYIERARNVIGQRLIPYMFLKNDNESIILCITTGIKKELCNVTNNCNDLKSLSLLLGFEYGVIWNKGGNTSIRVAKTDFIKFLRWVYVDE